MRGQVTDIGRHRAQQQNRHPVEGLRAEARAPLQPQHRPERQQQRRQAIDMTEMQIVRHQIAQIGAKDTRQRQRQPIEGAGLRDISGVHESLSGYGASVWRATGILSARIG
jgi:hypothetical protein